MEKALTALLAIHACDCSLCQKGIANALIEAKNEGLKDRSRIAEALE